MRIASIDAMSIDTTRIDTTRIEIGIVVAREEAGVRVRVWCVVWWMVWMVVSVRVHSPPLSPFVISANRDRFSRERVHSTAAHGRQSTDAKVKCTGGGGASGV